MKPNKLLYLLAAVAALSGLASCSLFEKCPDCFTPPDTFRFRFISAADSSDLVSKGIYSENDIYIWYMENGLKKEADLISYSDSGTNKTVFYSGDMAWLSVAGTKDFYLYLNNNETDTIYLDVIKRSDECCTYHPFRAVKYNSQTADYSNKEYIYLFKK
jgi:hypothetical protein